MAVVLLVLLIEYPATIVPPEQPRQPVPVFVAAVARTSSLVLPAGGNRLERWAYGDWRYYALAHDTLLNGAHAMLLPTQATLGRELLPGPAEAGRVRAMLAVDELHELRVEQQLVTRLLDRLHALYDRGRDTEVVNTRYQMSFVQLAGPAYTYFHNSNHAVADWLRQLGCEVRGPTFGSRWQVAGP